VRILAFSDVYRWRGYERLVDKYEPHVVTLAGDLTSDGVAAFWREGLEYVAEFIRNRRSLLKGFRVKTTMVEEGRLSVLPGPRKKCPICTNLRPPYEECNEPRHLDFAVLDHLRQLENHYHKSAKFRAVHARIHTTKFYRFLQYAGKRTSVLVVKGDHDDDFPGDYDPLRINHIPGCHEISGQTFEVKGTLVLGVSYQQTAYRRVSDSLLAKFPQRGGVVICHARQGNVRLVADLRPKLIIRGHHGSGRFLLDGIPAVFTNGAPAIITFFKSEFPHIRTLSVNEGRRVAPSPEIKISIEDLWSKDYPWLKPYPH
jgi:hypothetical protein